MVSIAVMAAAISLMYKIAELEGRSGFIWGCITFAICILTANFIKLQVPFVNIIIGLAISFMLMFLVKIIKK